MSRYGPPTRSRAARRHRARGFFLLSRLANGGQKRYNKRMTMAIKLTKVGNSTGAVFPREMLARLRVSQGDTLYFSEAPDGFRVTASNPDFEKKMALAEQIMREDRDILRVLAQ